MYVGQKERYIFMLPSFHNFQWCHSFFIFLGKRFSFLVLLMDYLKLFAAPVMASIATTFSSEMWAQEGGDPCLPVPWSWVKCSSTSAPPITSM